MLEPDPKQPVMMKQIPSKTIRIRFIVNLILNDGSLFLISGIDIINSVLNGT